jgi:hypothetical protein
MAIDLSSDATIYRDLEGHVGHAIVIVSYAEGINISIECEDCCEVLVSVDSEHEEEEDAHTN